MSFFSQVDFGIAQREVCPNCGRRYVKEAKKRMKLHGWSRRWSWKKLRFILICPICSR